MMMGRFILLMIMFFINKECTAKRTTNPDCHKNALRIISFEIKVKKPPKRVAFSGDQSSLGCWSIRICFFFSSSAICALMSSTFCSMLS